MPSLRRIYGECIFDKYSYYANFLPVEPVQVGDFGIIDDGAFTRLGSLKDQFGLVPELGELSGEVSSFEFQFGCEKTAAPNVAATANIPGMAISGAAKFAFSRTYGILFAAAGCRTQGLRNLAALEPSLKKCFIEKTWNPEWVAVTGTVRSDAIALLVGAEAGAEIELRAKAPIPVNFAAAAAAGGIEIAGENKLGLKIIGTNATPFLRIATVRRKLLRGVVVTYHKFANESPDYLADLRDNLIREGKPVDHEFDFREIEKKDGFFG